MITQFQDWWLNLPQNTRSVTRHIWLAFANFNQHGTRQAAALAYYAIFSVFPLVLLLWAAVSSLLGPTVASEQISNGLELFLPRSTVDVLRENVSTSVQQSSSFTLIALAGLIWSALGFFTNITNALDLIFQVPASRSMWRQRFVAFVMILLLVVLIVASFVTSGVLQLISSLLGNNPNIWIMIGRIFLPMGLDMVIFALLFRYVPARLVHWDAVWPAAILGAGIWQITKSGFAWYLANVANYQFVYGTVTTAIILLLYAYITASIFLLSAEICAQLNEWHIAQHQSTTPHAAPPTVR
jgi:membrane protein